MKSEKGQTLYYFLIFTLIIVISWAMMLNIAKLIRDRMIMQNIADNAAVSIATHRARTMNFVGSCNYLIGFLLRMGTRAEFVQIHTYGTDTVASYMFGDWRKGSNSALSSGVAELKKMVDLVQKGQETAMVAHLVYIAMTYKNLIEKGYVPVILPLPIKDFDSNMLENPGAGIIKIAEKHFGLKRNTKGITYKKTENVTYGNIHYVYTRMLGLELRKMILEALKKFGFLGGIIASADKAIEMIEKEFGINFSDYTDAPVYAKKDYSWYITADNFKDQKTQIVLMKMAGDDNKPLFYRWLGINYPSIYVFSAAAIYNTKGTMFPSRESELLGTISPKSQYYILDFIFHFSLPTTNAQIFYLAGEIAEQIPYIGNLLALLVSLYAENMNNMMFFKAISGTADSPMNNYMEAKEGGWAAHLVPFKTVNDDE